MRLFLFLPLFALCVSVYAAEGDFIPGYEIARRHVHPKAIKEIIPIMPLGQRIEKRHERFEERQAEPTKFKYIFAVGGHAGTTGLGLNFGVSFTPSFSVRFHYSRLTYGKSQFVNYGTSSVEGEITGHFNTKELFFDYHPFDGFFYLTAGAIYNDNKLVYKSNINSGEVFSFADTIISATKDGRIENTADFKKLSPYLGIGLGNFTTSATWFSVAMAVDMGVVFQNINNSEIKVSGFGAEAATIEANKGSARETFDSNAADFFRLVKFYPMVKISLFTTF